MPVLSNRVPLLFTIHILVLQEEVIAVLVLLAVSVLPLADRDYFLASMAQPVDLVGMTTRC